MSIKTKTDYTNEQLLGMVGKTMLVGISHYNLEGKIAELEQFFGTIVRATQEEGVAIKLQGTETERVVPPDFAAMTVARLGDYTLTTTGEVVKDPYYTASLKIYPKK